MCESEQTVAIACTLNATDFSERSERWRRLGSRAGIGVDRTRQGLSVVFENLSGVSAELVELAKLERECCAFADWAARDTGDHVILDVTADDDLAVQAVHDMHGAFAAAMRRD